MKERRKETKIQWIGISVIVFLLTVLISAPIAFQTPVLAEHSTTENGVTATPPKVAPQNEEIAKRNALRAQFAQSGSTLKPELISDALLQQATRIDVSTPLDFRASLAVSYYAKLLELRPSLILAVIEHESGFRQNASNSHQARGYMQILPVAERGALKAYGNFLGISYNPKRIFEPEYNIGIGSACLGGFLYGYKDEHHALSAYNRGGGGIQKYYRNTGTYVTGYSKVVLQLEKKYQALNP